MRNRGAVAALMALALLTAGCGKSAEDQAREETKKKLAEAGKQMEQAAKDLEAAATKGGQGVGEAMARMGIAVGGAVSEAAKTVGGTVEPVDFRELKGLLPENIGSLKRTASEGEKGGALGIVVAHAEGRYQGDHARMTLKITDPGNLSGFAAMAAMWMNMELDKETDTGYEKTGTANNRRFHEKFNKADKSGEYTVIVGNRFMVEANGTGVDMATMKKAVEQVDLARLESMKDVGTKK